MNRWLLLLALAPALAQSPNPDDLSESAKQLASTRRFDEAAALWKKALQIDPNHYPSLFNLGYMRFSLSEFSAAEPLLSSAAKLHPDDFAPHYVLGSELVQLGKREAAILEWRAALRVQPSNLKLMQILSVEYSKGGYFREACDIARRALALAPGEQNVWILAVKSCYEAHDPAALKPASDAVQRFPASARANFEYGYQLQRQGRMDESLPYLKKAMDADPAYEEPFYFYGQLLVDEEQFEQALPYLEKALADRPDYVSACVSLAKAQIGLDRLEQAVAQLNRCISLRPTHPQPHLLLSQVYFRLGDEQRARTEKESSLRLRRQDPGAMEAPVSRPFPSKVH